MVGQWLSKDKYNFFYHFVLWNPKPHQSGSRNLGMQLGKCDLDPSSAVSLYMSETV